MCRGKGCTHLFAIIKVVFRGAYNLVILVTLACYDDYIARMCQHRSCADGLAAVCDAQVVALVGYACNHIV